MKQKVLIGFYVVVALFVLSLFVVPLLHPDHRITKVGIVSNVVSAGNPYFYQTQYTITFKDGETIQVLADRSVPIPIGKPVAIMYSQRAKKLLGIQVAGLSH